MALPTLHTPNDIEKLLETNSQAANAYYRTRDSPSPTIQSMRKELYLRHPEVQAQARFSEAVDTYTEALQRGDRSDWTEWLERYRDIDCTILRFTLRRAQMSHRIGPALDAAIEDAEEKIAKKEQRRGLHLAEPENI